MEHSVYFDLSVRKTGLELLISFLVAHLPKKTVKRVIAYILFCANLSIPEIEALTGITRQTLYTIQHKIPPMIEKGSEVAIQDKWPRQKMQGKCRTSKRIDGTTGFRQLSHLARSESNLFHICMGT